MTAQEYHSCLAALDLSVYASARVLGISLSSAQRYAAGQRAIPEPVARLLRLLVKCAQESEARLRAF
jgi:hypothetical protein